jgi:hypothetical protein
MDRELPRPAAVSRLSEIQQSRQDAALRLYRFPRRAGRDLPRRAEKALGELARGAVILEPNIKPRPRRIRIGAGRAGSGSRHAARSAPGPDRRAGTPRSRASSSFRRATFARPPASSGAALLISPEGGLHHAAAALGVRAVVIFGGFISPATTGYELHTNLFTGGQACGMRIPARIAPRRWRASRRRPSRKPRASSSARETAVELEGRPHERRSAIRSRARRSPARCSRVLRRRRRARRRRDAFLGAGCAGRVLWDGRDRAAL